MAAEERTILEEIATEKGATDPGKMSDSELVSFLCD